MHISIIGDSISTYFGYNPPGYSVFYDKDNLESVNDTWWAKVIKFMKGNLCVNNSYSGSKVSGIAFPAANCDERTSFLHNNQYSPDIILIYIGFNDFGNGVLVWGNNTFSFTYAYEAMLKKIKTQYPNALIICGTLMKSFIKNNLSWEFPSNYGGICFDEYNDSIRKACFNQKCVLVDLAKSDKKYETLDGTHPTSKGHETIASCWISCLEKAVK